jgi:hypothetical protein
VVNNPLPTNSVLTKDTDINVTTNSNPWFKRIFTEGLFLPNNGRKSLNRKGILSEEVMGSLTNWDGFELKK